MDIGRNIGKQRSSLFVNRPAFNSMVDAVNKLRNIDFNPVYFSTGVSTKGILISLNDQYIKDIVDDPEFHFQISSNNNSSSLTTSIDIHAGRVITFDPDGGDVNVSLMTTNTGTSGLYADQYTINSISDGTYAVILEPDDPYNPTVFTPAVEPYYPTIGFSKDKIVIGRVVTAAGISTIEQFWNGGDIGYDTIYSYDDCSVEISPSKTVQLHEFNNNASTAITIIKDADRIVKVDSIGGCIGYTTWANCKADVITDFCAQVYDCLDNTGDFCSWVQDKGCLCDWWDWIKLNCTMAYITDHLYLNDIYAGLCGDHHAKDYPAPGGTNYSYLGNTGDYARNNCLYGLGYDTGTRCIDVANSQLSDTFGNTSVDFKLHELANSAWTVTTGEVITLGNLSTGAFRITGGCSIGESLQVTSACLTNYWKADDFSVDVSDDIVIDAGGDLSLYSRVGPTYIYSAGNFTADSAFNSQVSANGIVRLEKNLTNSMIEVDTDVLIQCDDDLAFDIPGDLTVDSVTMTQDLTGNYNLVDGDGNMYQVHLHHGMVEVF